MYVFNIFVVSFKALGIARSSVFEEKTFDVSIDSSAEVFVVIVLFVFFKEKYRKF